MGTHTPWHGAVPREYVRRQFAGAAGKKPSVSPSLCLDVNNLVIEHDLTCAATCFWPQAVWTGQWEDDMRSMEKIGVGSHVVDTIQTASRSGLL